MCPVDEALPMAVQKNFEEGSKEAEGDSAMGDMQRRSSDSML